MRLYLDGKEFSSVNEYADALLELETILVHVYQNDEDRVHKVNAIGGFVPYKPYSQEQVCDGIRMLIEIGMERAINGKI